MEPSSEDEPEMAISDEDEPDKNKENNHPIINQTIHAFQDGIVQANGTVQ